MDDNAEVRQLASVPRRHAVRLQPAQPCAECTAGEPAISVEIDESGAGR